MDKVPLCTSYSLGKLIVRPSPLKIKNESPIFLERIQGDICGPIHPSCGPFKYFMILIDASSRWSHVSLLSTRNVALAKFLAQIIKLRAHFLDYTVKRVRLDNAGEFTSHAFNDYCMSVGIVVEHSLAHVHTQNGLAKSLIKRLQLTARPLIMRTKLPVSMWGHAILHAASLIRMRPSENLKYLMTKILVKEKGTEKNLDHDENVLNEMQDIKTSPEEEMNDVNKEMSINYGQTQILWDRNERGDIDEIFYYSVASGIISGDDDPEPKSVFGPIVTTPKDVKPVGYKWIFVQKKNEKNEVTRYKARLVAQVFSQRPGIDYEETYSPVMDAITFRYLISLAVSKNLEMRLMDVKTTSGFVIIAVYVDDLNIISTNKEINEVIIHLKKEFEMKDLGKTKYCLGLQIEHMPNGILVHQSNYTKKVLKHFSMDKAKSLSTPMVGRSLNVDNDPFRPCEEDEDILGPEIPYLNAIGALMYITNCTRPDISFAVNLLARFSSSPTKRHWNEIKHIFRYLRGTTDLGLFYSNNSKQGLVSYADAATSSNHAEVIALHEASRECVWLRSMTQLIVTSYGLNKEKSPTIIYEDNATCVAQMKEGYIKSDRTKHILPRYFAYTQVLIKDNQIEMKYVQSSNNSADLFTKSLPTSIFKKHVHAIGMWHVHKT
ncbi:copia protein [Tanacetum coccineum]